jgi:hypothetical protein
MYFPQIPAPVKAAIAAYSSGAVLFVNSVCHMFGIEVSNPNPPINNAAGPLKMLVLFVAFTAVTPSANAQFRWSGPFSVVQKTTFRPFSRSLATAPIVLNTFKVGVSLPGYWYSGSSQQSAVIGLGYAFEHYVSDTLMYSIGPYIWYNTPIPTGSTKLPIGYGAAATYKGLLLFGMLTPDAVHWGPVVSLNFSFGNGGIHL